jgi:hypothetical protein
VKKHAHTMERHQRGHRPPAGSASQPHHAASFILRGGGKRHDRYGFAGGRRWLGENHEQVSSALKVGGFKQELVLR